MQAYQLLRHWREMEADSLKRRVGSNWLLPRGKIGPGSDSTLVDANGQYESTVLFKDLEYPAWKSWDLSALTQKWITGAATNYGVILWATNEDVNGMNLFFRSSEYTTDPTMQPKLEIIWSQLPRTVYFLKDHLGSIRASVQDTSTAPVVGYDDYDPWGYVLAGRSSITSGWGTPAGIMKNKFTGKEYDDDYGLNWIWVDRRPYMSDIGRWGVTEPLAGKFPGLSPYVYSINNPILFFDPNGAFPYTFHIRAFAPPTSFRRFGFHDDARGFTSNLKETSRVKQQFTIDATARTFDSPKPTSDPSIRLDDGASKTGTPEGKAVARFLRNGEAKVTQEFEGSNPFYYGLAPDIEVKTRFNISEDLDAGTLTITALGSSKQFPATEAFVTDAKGNSVFLGVGAAFGNPNSLILAGQKEIFKNTIIIKIDQNGVFQNVQFQGRTYSIEEFNKLFNSQNPGPFKR